MAQGEVHGHNLGSDSQEQLEQRHSRGHQEDTRLHTLCKEGNYKKIKEFILTSRADLPSKLAYRQGVFGYTPIHEAVSSGHSKVLELLLEQKGDPNCRANSGYTPLHLAALSGHVDCVRVLSANNADISNTDEYGKTPLQLAEMSSKHDIAKVLRSAEIIREVKINGPNLNELLKTPQNLLEDDCLNSALLAVVESDNPANVGKLILRGATIVDEALAKSRNFKNHAITAALLMIKAAMENDRILVLKLYGENVHDQETKIPLSAKDNLNTLQSAVRSNKFKTVILIELSRRNNASAVREELLLRTDVDRNSGTVLWFGLRLMQLEISWLKKIYWVKKLRLARNEFSSLPSEMGNYLKQCTKLDLQWNKLCEIPQSLLELPSLNELKLSHNNLANIPDVPEWSTSLVVLDLSYNHLLNLPNSVVAPNLRNLNISNNHFYAVPECVCSFIGLTTLNIANNPEIVALPSELGRLKNILNLNLDGLINLNVPPKSVQVTTADCIRYLKNQLRSTRAYYRMKMMVVGKQGTGKSTLVALLCNKEVGNESTVGVDVSEWKYAPAYNKKSFHFSIWDFSGQEAYYTTHQCFLSEHSLYLLLWNVTKGDAGIADLKPWLNNISLRAPDSCVIVVGTFLDKVSNEDQHSGKLHNLIQKVEELTRQYRLFVANITVVGLKDCMENVEKLKDLIYNAATEYKVNGQCVMGQLIPSSYHALDAILSTIHNSVKEGKHKPIMHTAEFKKMIKDLHLVDIQDDDDELHTVTRFLHEVGSLLYYEDHKHNLDDLYFVDPCWLCDLMSTVVTVKEQNPYVKQGILRSKNIPFLFKDQRFPYRYFNQYITLLNRFEIALPLDKDFKRILIPSMLPENRPDIVAQQQPDYQSCYKRFILFSPTTYQGQSLRCPAPSGLWSRLLSRIMNTVKEVRNVLSEQVPVEDDFIISPRIQNVNTPTAVFNNVCKDALDQMVENSFPSEKPTHSNISEEPLEKSSASETSSATYSNAFEGPLETSETSSIMTIYSNAFEEPPMSSLTASVSLSVSQSQLSQKGSQDESVEVFPIEGGGSLVYWRTGLFYDMNKLTFSIQSLAENTKYHDKDGILILASEGAEGRNILGQLIDLVEKLISEWYPGLHGQLEQRVPCSECLKIGIPCAYEFKVDQLLPLIADHKLSHECGAKHTVQLIEVVPDLLLADLDSVFLLNPKELTYKQEEESLLGTGAFGEVYRGEYKGQAVTIKLYNVKQSSKVGEMFKELRSESKVLQQLYHPCLVCMVGVTVNPTMTLVLEEAPEGSLEIPLLREQRTFSRIVVYRIAIQVASALRFLHSINIIYRDLKAGNILLWSLSPDHLINCKLTGFSVAVYTDPAGTKGLHGTKGFIAPEVSHVNHAREHSVYDHQADIFSFGMFLYQLVARRHPFHSLKPFKIEAAIGEGKRPQLEDISVAEIGLYYMSRIMKLCWAGNPSGRPTNQHIIEWLSAPALQLIVSVVPFNGKHSIRNGYIVTPVKGNEVGPSLTSSELWICCDSVEGGELKTFTTNTMEEACTHSIKENQICCIKQCGQYVWIPSRTDLESGVVHIFNRITKDLVHSLELKENAVSCITSSDHLVYLGTMEGSCLVFPINVRDIQTISELHYVYVSEHSVDGVALSQSCLWVSTRNQIYFLNSETLLFEGVVKRTKNTHAFVGKMMLSGNGDLMWSAHLKGVIMSAWNAHQLTHVIDVDMDTCAKEKCHIGDLEDRIMTAMCTALDTVWIGLSSGYILVFAMDPPGELLTYFRPYNSFIRFLSANKYPGPCQKEECIMLCGGKDYRPDDSFKELPDFARKDDKDKPVGTAGVAVLWEVLPAKYTRQVQYLSDGRSWLNYSTLEKAMNDTGFTESMQYCQSTMVNTSTTANVQDDSITGNSTDNSFGQQDTLAHQNAEL